VAGYGLLVPPLPLGGPLSPPARRAERLLLLLLLPASLGAGPAAAQEERPVDRAAPWLAGAGLFAASTLLDRDVRALVPAGGGDRHDDVLRALNALGNPRYLVPVLGGSWVLGRLAGEPGLARSAVHVGVALLAGGVANGSLKYAVGRERPAGGDPGEFRPFSPSNAWQSFPSGHAVVAFSMATALAVEARSTPVTLAGYTAASLVAWSQVYKDKHWTSDVVGGALVGAAASRAALALLHRRAPHSAAVPALAVIPGPDGSLSLVVSY
jgi:membrane-associated phospholipid phosphatase